MRSPRRIRSRCSSVCAAGLRSAVTQRFVDEFCPLSLLIPLCTIHCPAWTRRGCRPPPAAARAFPVWSMRAPLGTSRERVRTCTLLQGPGAWVSSGTPISVTDAPASSGALKVQSAVPGNRAVSPGRDYGAVVPLKGHYARVVRLMRCDLRPSAGPTGTSGGCTGIRVCVRAVHPGGLQGWNRGKSASTGRE